MAENSSSIPRNSERGWTALNSRNEGRIFRIELVDVVPGGEPVTKAVEIGASRKQVGELLEADSSASKSDQARKLILELTESGPVGSAQLDAQVAQATELAVRTVRDLRLKLGKEGLVRAIPDNHDGGTRKSWFVARTEPRQKS
jgi:hypothetical protein